MSITTLPITKLKFEAAVEISGSEGGRSGEDVAIETLEENHRGGWRRRIARAGAVLVLAASLGLGAVPAVADDHDPEDSGHPVRIVAYFVHPIGVILDYLIFRPAHWVVSHEPFQTLVGHEPED